jgi:hypothetical protein
MGHCSAQDASRKKCGKEYAGHSKDVKLQKSNALRQKRDEKRCRPQALALQPPVISIPLNAWALHPPGIRRPPMHGNNERKEGARE